MRSDQHNSDPAQILLEASKALIDKKDETAKEIIRRDYPFSDQIASKRGYTELQKLWIFVRDGFIDRYTGKRLVYSGLLRLLSFLMPDEFAYHPHGKLESCHIAYYELMPRAIA